MQKSQAVPVCMELSLLGETGEQIAAVTEAQKRYIGNRLGNGIGWGGRAGKISEDCPAWREGWCEVVKWEMGMNLVGGEGARERRKDRRLLGGEGQGGTMWGLRARVTDRVLGGFTQELGSDVV